MNNVSSEVDPVFYFCKVKMGCRGVYLLIPYVKLLYSKGVSLVPLVLEIATVCEFCLSPTLYPFDTLITYLWVAMGIFVYYECQPYRCEIFNIFTSAKLLVENVHCIKDKNKQIAYLKLPNLMTQPWVKEAFDRGYRKACISWTI